MPNPQRDHVLKTAMELQPVLIAYLAGMVQGIDAAEDVFQDTIIVICEKWTDVDPHGNVRGWCFEIARRTALDWLRKHQRRPVTLSKDALDTLARDPGWEAQARRDALPLEALQHCLRKLTAHTRELLDLRYAQNLSIEAIAKKVLRPVESLYVTFTRARAQVRECVARQLRGEAAL